MTESRSTDALWRSCYTAALTGLTLALGQKVLQEDGAPRSVAAIIPEPGSEIVPATDSAEPVDASSADYEQLVRIAVAIADTSLNVIRGPQEEKVRREQPKVTRPSIAEVGTFKAHKTK